MKKKPSIQQLEGYEQRKVTIIKRYGNDFYSKIAKISPTLKGNSEKARLTAMKRWHPSKFDEQGNLKEEL